MGVFVYEMTKWEVRNRQRKILCQHKFDKLDQEKTQKTNTEVQYDTMMNVKR